MWNLMARLKRQDSMVMKALELAERLHDGQKDKQGEDYLKHACRVGLAGETKEEMIVGLLHGLLEDTTATVETLIEAEFPDEVISAIVALTRLRSETYAAYIKRVSKVPLAVVVKRNDIADNLSRENGQYPSLRKRYESALEAMR